MAVARRTIPPQAAAVLQIAAVLKADGWEYREQRMQEGVYRFAFVRSEWAGQALANPVEVTREGSIDEREALVKSAAITAVQISGFGEPPVEYWDNDCQCYVWGQP